MRAPGQQAQRERALLGPLKPHPIWAEIQGAEVRRHEVPYTWTTAEGWTDAGAIDLLYRVGGGWRLVDFKTDELRDREAIVRAVEEYRPQLERYVQAVRSLLHVEPAPGLCFLDVEGEARVVSL